MSLFLRMYTPVRLVSAEVCNMTFNHCRSLSELRCLLPYDDVLPWNILGLTGCNLAVYCGCVEWGGYTQNYVCRREFVVEVGFDGDDV